jgi:hypothetical protein
MLLTSCATSGVATKEAEVITEVIEKPIVIDTACKWVRPIYVSKADEFTDGTARQVLAHNKAYAANCGTPKK